MFYDGINGLFRVVIVGACAYVALIFLLRVSGKRTLSKMNAFDLIVTVALGSTLATILLSKDVALLEGITAFILLIGMQFLIAWMSVRSSAVRQLVKAEPALLFYRGAFLNRVMRMERVTEDEVRAAIRAQGVASMNAVEAVVLETDGSFAVIEMVQDAATSLQGVAHYAEQKKS
ncbi:MAG: DUF421 domain-containing protein [Anaerolineae bacterium]|nr:DUF421 domain-containing protein [Anaerolineae bacterium]